MYGPRLAWQGFSLDVNQSAQMYSAFGHDEYAHVPFLITAKELAPPSRIQDPVLGSGFGHAVGLFRQLPALIAPADLEEPIFSRASGAG